MMSPSSPSSLQSKRRYASLDDEKMFFFFFQKKNKGAAAVERFAELHQVVTLTAPTASSSSSSSFAFNEKYFWGYFLYPKLLGEVSSPEFFSHSQNSLIRRTFDENKSSERGPISTNVRHEREGIRLNERKHGGEVAVFIIFNTHQSLHLRILLGKTTE